MARSRPTPAALRAEARILTIAGVMLLVIGFPLTIILVTQAMGERGAALLPLTLGLPPIVLGYLACHFASERLVQAKAREQRR